MKKKIAALSISVAMLAIALVGGTLAYFTDADDAANTFTVGNVQIDLTEPTWDTEGVVDAEDAYPGEALAKDPAVTNTGANPCFVRVSVTGLDVLKNRGISNEVITFETDDVAGALGEGWEDGGVGYFYYTEVLNSDPAETTTALFDHIRIPADVANVDGEWSNIDFDVVVKAEAVQAQGAKPSWSEVQTMTLADIQEWFDTCMPPEQQ